MPGSIQLVIFDCDGVLVDSEPLSNAVLAAALTEAGLPTTAEEALATFKGLHIDDVIARAEAGLGGRLPADFVPVYEARRAEAFGQSLVAMPGAAEAVRAVKAAGIEVCVASQGKREKSELTLALTGLRDLFGAEAIFSSHSVARGKPHPDLFLHAAAEMSAAPRETVVVEDTTTGVRGAVAAGMRTIGLAEGEAAGALAAAGAETIAGLAELPVRLGVGR